MEKNCLIVCERSGVWAAALRRQLPPEIPLREVRAGGECERLLAAAPESLLALELTKNNTPAVLSLLADLSCRFPRARAMVLAERGLEGWEPLVREAGAVYLTTSPRRLQGFAGIAARHFEQVSRPRLSLATRVWDSLPWSDAAIA